MCPISKNANSVKLFHPSVCGGGMVTYHIRQLVSILSIKHTTGLRYEGAGPIAGERGRGTCTIRWVDFFYFKHLQVV